MKDTVQLQTCQQAEAVLPTDAQHMPPTGPTIQHTTPGAGGVLDIEMIQMMVQQLNSEIVAFKSNKNEGAASNCTAGVATTPGNASLDGVSNLETLNPQNPVIVGQINATTDSVNAQIDKVKRQIEIHKKIMKEQREENTSLVKPKNASLNDIKANIDTLKKHMESISAEPIAEIVATDPEEQVQVSDDLKKSEENAESGEKTSDANSKASAAPHPNAKAKDDLLKKYLLLKVVKDNLGILTAKMNKMLAAKGIEPANSTTIQPGKVDTEPKETLIAKEDAITTIDDKEDEASAEMEGDENDDYYMYNEEDIDSDLYQEESDDETKAKETKVSDVQSDAQTADPVDEAKESSITTTQDRGPSPSDEGNIKDQVENDEKATETATASAESTSKVKMTPFKLYESPALADAEAFLKNYKKKALPEEDKKTTSSGDNIGDSTKRRTYTLLLKLQKEMADMQLQMSKLQDHVRSTNAALQTIFDHEFSDM